MESEKTILESLTWMGLDWDEKPTRQSDMFEQYRRALTHLESAGLLFACDRSRRELRAAAEAAGAPHGAGTTVCSTAAMRPQDKSRYRFLPGDRNHRLLVKEGIETIDDELLGQESFDVAAVFGDPIVWTRQDAPSYQFAVVVDDLSPRGDRGRARRRPAGLGCTARHASRKCSKGRHHVGGTSRSCWIQKAVGYPNDMET